MSVAIEVHGIVGEGRRHERSVAHRAGIGAAQGQRIVTFLARLQKKLLQLTTEELGAARIGEGKGSQRVDDPRIAHHPSPTGFHADDADDDFRRYAVCAVGALQIGFVLVPEQYAVAHVAWCDEFLPVA
ncbi:hypothetical protein D3C80_1696260 [compost metagenome]